MKRFVVFFSSVGDNPSAIYDMEQRINNYAEAFGFTIITIAPASTGVYVLFEGEKGGE